MGNSKVLATSGGKGDNLVVADQISGGTNRQLWARWGDKLLNKAGYLIDVSGDSSSQGTNAIAYSDNGGSNQQWEEISGGYIQTKMGTDYVLDVWNDNVVMYPVHDTVAAQLHQQWVFEAMTTGKLGRYDNPSRIINLFENFYWKYTGNDTHTWRTLICITRFFTYCCRVHGSMHRR